jgi:hypothetical protein
LIKAWKAFASNAPLEWSELTPMAHFPLIKELVEDPLIKTRRFKGAGRKEKMLPAKRRCHHFFFLLQPLGLPMEDKS